MFRQFKKIHESSENNTATLLESGKISYIISTSAKGRNPADDDVKIRLKACQLGIPCLTSIDTANALADSLLSDYSEMNTELVDVNHLRSERMELKFTKIHGCGNDYIYFNCFEKDINLPESLAVILSDRHIGIGGDGVVLICPSEVADAKMRMFNIDGSEGKMCGNAIRCVAKYLYDNNIVKKLNITVETLSGIKYLELFTSGGLVSSVKVNMGNAILEPKLIPVSLDRDKIIAHPLQIDGTDYKITCVSMGNPHAVVFLDGVDSLKLDKVGSMFENADIFPDRVNTEFIEILGRNNLKMRVWKRGSGETMACGTGACAAAVASVLNGYCDMNADITVHLLGGDLTIRYTGNEVFMTGPCKKVYDGVVEI